MILPPPEGFGGVKFKMENYNELYHYGIKGMKWGVRRYQNADGSLTAAGKKRINRLNELDRKNDLKKDYKSLSKRNVEKFGDKKDPVSKFLTMTNSKNISHLDKTIERNKEKINKIIDDMKSQKVDLVVAYDWRSGRMKYKQSDEQTSRLMREVDTKPEIKDLIKDGYKVDYGNGDCYVNKITSRGADLSISIVDRDGGTARIMDKPSNFVKSANRAIEKELASTTNDITKDLYEVYRDYATTDNIGQGQMSEKEFTSRVDPYYIRVSKINGRRICEIGFDDGDMLGGHSLDVEFDLDAKDRKYYHSMNG